MGKAVYVLGDVAERGVAMIEIRCGRCERYGRLSVTRLMAEHGAMGKVMRARVGDGPHRDEAQIQNRCYPFCRDLTRLFQKPKPVERELWVQPLGPLRDSAQFSGNLNVALQLSERQTGNTPPIHNFVH